MASRLIIRGALVIGALLCFACAPLWAETVASASTLSPPAGFQKTLGYLESELYPYAHAELQQQRNRILTEDLETGIIAQLRQTGQPQSEWPQGAKLRVADFEKSATAARQMLAQQPNGPAILAAIDGNRDLPPGAQNDPLVRSIILLKWGILEITEQVRQISLWGGNAGAPASSGAAPVASTPVYSRPLTEEDINGKPVLYAGTDRVAGAEFNVPPPKKREWTKQELNRSRTEGYWYDPGDRGAKPGASEDLRMIYVKLRDQPNAMRMTLKLAKADGYVPADATIAKMTHYREAAKHKSNRGFENNIDTSDRQRPRNPPKDEEEWK